MTSQNIISAVPDLDEQFPVVAVDKTAVEVDKHVVILALDLGTKTGYACRKRDGTLVHGTQEFTPRASWSPGQKWARYRQWLSATVIEHCVTVIAYEDVKNHAGVLAAHAYGGFLAMLEMVADQHIIRLQPVGVGVVKKSWTGAGNADKDMMIAQAKVRGFRVVDDNNADALAILHWAVKAERGESPPVVKRPKKATKKTTAVAQLELA